MACAETDRTSAFIDGELDPAASIAAEGHIAGCAECQAFVAAAAEASEILRARGARLTAPQALRDRIGRALDEESAVRPARPAKSFWWGALSGAGVSGLAAALAVAVLLPPAPASMTVALADAHVRALMDSKTIAVVSSDHHTVKPWFAGRIALSPPVTDFAGQGFRLLGGRLQTVRGRPMAVLAYGHGAHEIDLFVWASRGGGEPQALERHGYHVIPWTVGDLDFAAVSDVDPAELAAFVHLVRTARE